MGLTRYFTLIVFQPEVMMFVKNVIKCSRIDDWDDDTFGFF